MGHKWNTVTRHASTMIWPLLFISLFHLANSSLVDQQQQLSQLAAAGNGIIKLDASTFDLLVAPQRTWSISVHFTALDQRRRCAPCRLELVSAFFRSVYRAQGI